MNRNLYIFVTVALFFFVCCKSDDSTNQPTANNDPKEALVDAARSADLMVGTFSRENEPGGESTMEWGTKTAIEDLGKVPDVIYDLGGVGKEPMVRVLARTPMEALDIVRML